MADGTRILQVAHGHPQFHPGGTEMVALALHRQALAEGLDSWYLGAREGGEAGPGTTMTSLTPDHREAALNVRAFDSFRLEQPDNDGFLAEFRRYLELVRPDVVHFHHPLNFGLEAFHAARQVLPRANILLTMHDYYLICANRGQLYRHDTKARCDGPSLRDCPKCLPGRSADDFALRTLDITNTIGLVDTLVSPSEFLKGMMERHLPPGRTIELVENGYIGEDAPALSRRRSDGDDIVFGYFGNIVAIKGLQDLLDAAEMLKAKGRRGFRIDVHGAQLIPDPDLKARMEQAETALGAAIRFLGGYRGDDAAALLSEVDCVVFPSVWWENAPLVVYEALHHERAVIAYPHGGGAEILRRYGSGLIADTSRPEALARQMERVLDDPAIAVARTVLPLPGRTDLLAAYRELYRF